MIIYKLMIIILFIIIIIICMVHGQFYIALSSQTVHCS